MSTSSPPDAQASIYDLFHAVRSHPDFVFGTVFTRDDFEAGVPDDFPVNRAKDRLAEAGNELIYFECGMPDETDEFWQSTEPVSIFDLFRTVQSHPDYVFGTVFVPGDFPGGVVPEDFPASSADDMLASEGNQYIFDVLEEMADED